MAKRLYEIISYRRESKCTLPVSKLNTDEVNSGTCAI